MANAEHYNTLRRQEAVWRSWITEHPDWLPKELSALVHENEAFVWNHWRRKNPGIKPDLSGSDLSGADLPFANLCDVNLRETVLVGTTLSGSNLFCADLSSANLQNARLENVNFGRANLNKADLFGAKLRVSSFAHANLSEAKLGDEIIEEGFLGEAHLEAMDFTGAHLNKTYLNRAHFFCSRLDGADLSEAHLERADFTSAQLVGAILEKAHLCGANLTRANLSGANLRHADIRRTQLVQTNFTDANLEGCWVHGVTAWDVILEGAIQSELIITKEGEPAITIDNLELAHFIYLLSSNQKLRQIIDTVGKKAVLVLGRFTPERKIVLNAIRDQLRKLDYLPMLFDFDVPSSRDVTETVRLLAHMSRFIIADLTEPSSIPKELEAIVPTLAVPVKPLLEGPRRPYSMFSDYWKYEWVLDVHQYETTESLIESLTENVIGPAEAKARELDERRNLSIGNTTK